MSVLCIVSLLISDSKPCSYQNCSWTKEAAHRQQPSRCVCYFPSLPFVFSWCWFFIFFSFSFFTWILVELVNNFLSLWFYAAAPSLIWKPTYLRYAKFLVSLDSTPIQSHFSWLLMMLSFSKLTFFFDTPWALNKPLSLFFCFVWTHVQD